MKKIKPLAEKHRFRNWLRKLFGVKPRPSSVFSKHIGKELDEMHLLRPVSVNVPVRISAEVTDRHLDGLPLTKAEIECRVHRALAEALTRQIIEKELYTLTVHVDAPNCETRYRATVTIYAPVKEAEG